MVPKQNKTQFGARKSVGVDPVPPVHYLGIPLYCPPSGSSHIYLWYLLRDVFLVTVPHVYMCFARSHALESGCLPGLPWCCHLLWVGTLPIKEQWLTDISWSRTAGHQGSQTAELRRLLSLNACRLQLVWNSWSCACKEALSAVELFLGS